MSIAQEMGEIFEQVFDPKASKEENIQKFIHEFTIGKSTDELVGIIEHLTYQLAWPMMLASYRKVSQGKPTNNTDGVIQPTQAVSGKSKMTNGETEYIAPVLELETVLKYATIKGKSILECTKEDIELAIQENQAKMLGYKKSNERLEKLLDKYSEYGVEKFGQCSKSQLQSIIDIWQDKE